MSLYSSLKEEFGQRYIRNSCIADESTEKIFCSFLSGLKIKHALEIGTWFGVSALALTYFADKVSTIDYLDCAEAPTLWKKSGKIDKISKYIIGSEKEKATIIECLDFDFAFIDGKHRYDYVKNDFELTKRCGRVLFHDYYTRQDKIPGLDFYDEHDKDRKDSEFEEVKKFVDELPKEEVIIRKPFAFWKQQ